MDQFEDLTVAETLHRVSAWLGCSPTSAQVAAYLDEHDELRHLREEFLVPKVAELPPCESETPFAERHWLMSVNRRLLVPRQPPSALLCSRSVAGRRRPGLHLLGGELAGASAQNGADVPEGGAGQVGQNVGSV